jgi:hypothetical protein
MSRKRSLIEGNDIRRVVCVLLFATATAWAARPAAKPKPKPKPPPISAEERAARALMGPLSLRDRVAQLVIGVCYGEALSARNADFQKYRHWVRDLHIGGLIVNNRVFNGIARNAEPHATALFLNQMQKLAKTPLIVGGDFERGAFDAHQCGHALPLQHGVWRGSRRGRLAYPGPDHCPRGTRAGLFSGFSRRSPTST